MFPDITPYLLPPVAFRISFVGPTSLVQLQLPMVFSKAIWIRMPRVNDKQLIKYLRAQQLRRLCGLNTIWK